MSEKVVNLAVSALTSWKVFNAKHMLEHHDESGNSPMKRARTENPVMLVTTAPHKVVDPMMARKPQLKPYPFFYYTDYSTEVDPDPLTPLTFPGRVPNFPAKLHAILSQPEFSEIIDWLPHGRSWRVLKPREFEQQVIPKFFEHSKFSSFVRQANGWGFRRITQGPDRNAYYHEKFLRGLPHLCKSMRRPGVAEKRVVDPDLEPDFYKIAQVHPVPSRSDEESIFLQKTLQSGPKSRMPIVTGHFRSTGMGRERSGSDASASSVGAEEGKVAHAAGVPAPNLVHRGPSPAYTGTASMSTSVSTPGAVAAPVAAQQAPAAQTQELQHSHLQAPAPIAAPEVPLVPQLPAPVIAPASSGTVTPEQPAKVMDFNQMALQFAMPTADSNPAVSSFAAGFAAATAHYQQHFFSMMNQMASAKQLPEGFAPMTVMANMPASPTA